jgi:4-hydroxyphenylpyruvate dioxygenase
MQADLPRVRRSVATVCLSGMLEDKLHAAAEAGFDGIEVFENDLVASASSPEDIRHLCADLGLSVELYQPFRDFEAVPADRLEANLRRAERKFAVMRRLGVDLLLVCSTLSPDAIDDDDLAAEQLHALAERASEHGVRVAYEALAWGRFVNTWHHSWRIVRRADHPCLGVCLDSFHVLAREPAPSGIDTIAGGKLFFLQLADAPRLEMDVLQWSRHHRVFPGQGSFDLTGFVEQVLAAGYTGPLSLEVFNDVFRQTDPRPAALDAMRSLRGLEESVAARPRRAGRRVEVTGPPKAPALSGCAFVELAVDDPAATEVTATLDALGFRQAGRHRSKPVQLWCQGGANVLVNRATTDPRIAAIAVESADPQQSLRRAEALLAPRLPRRRGRAEADLAAVEAPDGTQVFFCRTGAGDPASWRSDFVSTDAEPSGRDLLGHVDHVALAEPFDHVADTALFFRGILGLRPSGEDEFAAPFGLVRSTSVESPPGRLRIAMHSPVLRRGSWAPAVPDPEHVAFATDDVLAAARAARERGAPILRIPGNYYDDLDARYAMPPEFLTQLRDLDVMYDRDEHGELLHFFTELLGVPVFFEVVQRVGGYRGYGAANAPVRMAAHRRARLRRAAAS